MAGLLLAPRTGKKLREEIAEGVNEGVDHVRSAGKEMKQRAQKVVDQARDQVQEAMEAGDKAYSHAKKA